MKLIKFAALGLALALGQAARADDDQHRLDPRDKTRVEVNERGERIDRKDSVDRNDRANADEWRKAEKAARKDASDPNRPIIRDDRDVRVRDGKAFTDADKAIAKRYVIAAHVAFEHAKVSLRGLHALADDDTGALDMANRRRFVNAAETSLKAAAAQLQHLVNLPANDKDARTHLTKLQTQLAQAQAELKNLETPALPRGSGGDAYEKEGREVRMGRDYEPFKKQIKAAWKAVDDAWGDFKTVADDYKVSTRLPTP